MLQEKIVKGPGRPKSDDNKKAKLIETAALLFSVKGYDGVSLKEISAEARVTPAMISYYFEGKSGLMHAVMEHAITLMLKMSEKISEDAKNGSFIDSFTEHYLPFICEHQWLVPLLLREVLTKDSDSRHMFLEDYGPRSLQLISPSISQDIDKQILRSDLNPDFMQLSLFGMSILPFLAAPVLSPMYGYTPDKEFAEKYAAHVRKLFLEGAKPKE